MGLNCARHVTATSCEIPDRKYTFYFAVYLNDNSQYRYKINKIIVYKIHGHLQILSRFEVFYVTLCNNHSAVYQEVGNVLVARTVCHPTCAWVRYPHSD